MKLDLVLSMKGTLKNMKLKIDITKNGQEISKWV